MELHQNLAHDADARLGALALQRQRVEVFYNLLHGALEFRTLHAARQLRLAFGHPVLEQVVGRAWLNLVGARAVERHHEQVAVAQRVHSLQQHLRRDLEAGVHLAQVFERKRDNRNMAKAGGFECFADERDVVGGAAATAGLRNEHGQLVGVVAPRGNGFHNLACDQDRRIANVVVHVLQARVHSAVVDARQQIDVVAKALENGHEQLEVVRSHLRGQNRVARFLHLLGELHAFELGRGCLALLEALASFGRGFFREGRRGLDGLCYGLNGCGVGGTGRLLAGACGVGGCDARFGLGQKLFHVEAARGAFLRGGFGVGLFIGLVFQRCE